MDMHRYQANSPLAGRRVVVIEDEALTQLQLSKILLNAGMVVAGQAPDGKSGLDMALQEKPDIVLMDINMPVMNGLEAAERILAQHSCCLVFLTAYNEPEFQQKAQALGANGMLIKPVSKDTLLPHLERLCRGARETT